MTRRAAVIILPGLLAVLCSSIAAAQTTDVPAFGVTVHVDNGSTGQPAAEGTPVELLVVTDDNRQARLAGVTDSEGIARIAVPMALTAGPAAGAMATVEHAGLVFRSDLVRLDAFQPEGEMRVTVFDLAARVGLPIWSTAALAGILVAAVALIALRRSDRQLPA